MSPLQLTILDDDPTSRELLELFAAQAGLQVESRESGDAELAHLRAGGTTPSAILADLHMPGTSGAALARALRRCCGRATRLIAMSASAPDDGSLAGYDLFLAKPFGPAELLFAVQGSRPGSQVSSPEQEMLSQATYQSLAESLSANQLRELYAMCLTDTERRIAGMRAASVAGDREAYTRAAHAIKGACGMVGAVELAALAEEMEEDGPADDGNVGALDEFLLALRRLQGILDAIGHPEDLRQTDAERS